MGSFFFAEERAAWPRNLAVNLKSDSYFMAQTPQLWRPSANKALIGECVASMAQHLGREVISPVKQTTHIGMQPLRVKLLVISRCFWQG